MGAINILDPEEVWDYWIQHPEEIIGVMFGIATYEDLGIEIYMTADNAKNLRVVVEADSIEIYEESMINDIDCLKSCQKIYDEYLTESVSSILARFDMPPQKSKQKTEEEIEEESIEERELELDTLVYDFYSNVLGFNAKFEPQDEQEMLEDIKEHFLEYMARKHSIPIYRPMYLEDVDTGKEYYTDYPYEDMVFEDEDNPVYKN